MMKWQKKPVLALVWWLVLPGIGLGQESDRAPTPWKLEKDKKGIQVYSRQVADSKVKEVRVTCEIRGTLAQVVAFVTGIEHYPEIMDRVAEAYIIQRLNDRELYYYHALDIPWPASDREVVMHMKAEWDDNARQLVISANNVPGRVADQPGRVRVPLWRSKWVVQEVGLNRLRIAYTFQVDPGGGIPVWLTNALIANAPYQSFAKMEQQLELPYYQNRSFSFLKP
ncbi:START domain-containing protein [Larkinella sp. VNQ87]|uniref:START domain-containing protein n=1 Tax=Larkinella sp. VNQ87 TaxID=3400921 RepID=UPI003C0B569B